MEVRRRAGAHRGSAAFSRQGVEEGRCTGALLTLRAVGRDGTGGGTLGAGRELTARAKISCTPPSASVRSVM